METLHCWVGMARWAAIYFLKLQRNFHEDYTNLLSIKHSTLILCSTPHLVGQCFVVYASLNFFCNLPKRVNCGNIAMLGGSGKMPFTEKNCTKFFTRTEDSQLILCCSVRHHGRHNLVGYPRGPPQLLFDLSESGIT